MERKFKVGDKVGLRRDAFVAKYFKHGLTGLEIKSICEDGDYAVYESDKSDYWYVKQYDLKLAKRGRPKKVNHKRFMVYGTGCNNKSELFEDEQKLKAKLRQYAQDSDWTGDIIGYKLTPIYKAEKTTRLTKFK